MSRLRRGGAVLTFCIAAALAQPNDVVAAAPESPSPTRKRVPTDPEPPPGKGDTGGTSQEVVAEVSQPGGGDPGGGDPGGSGSNNDGGDDESAGVPGIWAPECVPEAAPDSPPPAGDDPLWELRTRCELRYLAVAQLTPADLLPDLYDEARARLPVPEPEFLPLDPEFGWTYVKVGTDVRISSPLEPVSATASACALAQCIWATVTATPALITFEPGEPGAIPLLCSPADAQVGYDPAWPGLCSHEYRNTSAVSANGRTFTTTTTIDWDVTYTSSSGSGTQPALTTTSTQDLAVAEYQALVTCTGPRPEQGGC